MNGFFLAIGKQGTGKSLFMMKLLVDSYHEKKRPIYSNTTIFELPYTPIVRIKEEGKKYKPDTIGFLTQLIKNADFFNNSIIIIDEIHIYFDSMDFMRKHNRIAQTFFSQLRKRKILLLGTSQYLMNVDIRIRRQCSNVFDMTHVYKDLFTVATHEIDGYFTNEISCYNIVLNDYYKYYDTNEIITQ